MGKYFKLKREIPLYIMIFLPLVILLIYSYGPMFGLIMIFQKFVPAFGFLGSEWIGLYNFERLFIMPDIDRVVLNTLKIAVLKIVTQTVAAVVIAILLNEIRSPRFKKGIQTIIYLPYFLSWVILGGILRDILARDGVINTLLEKLGMPTFLFLGEPHIFPWVLVISELWQVTGFWTIVYLAAIAGINPHLYEAASIDGANRWKQTWNITLPGMNTTIVLMVILSLGYILNAGFEQILMLYTPITYSTGDVIDTWVYRQGLVSAQYSLATTVGVLRSLISFVLVVIAYYFAYKKADYRVF
jgi:putative aldouronate transport system permease protein